MQDTDQRELQKDVFVIIIALIIVLSIILFYVTLIKTVAFDNPQSLWWLPSTLSLATTFFSYRQYRQYHFRRAVYSLVAGLTLTIVAFMVAPNTQFPYLELYLIALIVAIAGLLIKPVAALHTAVFAMLSTLIMTIILDGVSPASLAPLAAPWLIALVVVAIIWGGFDRLIEAIRWVLDRHGRAHQRSRQLYENQYELEIAYKLLEQANISLLDAQVEAVRANEFKTRFMTNLSHELRTPLSAIINLSFILSRGRYGEVTPEQQDYLMRIHDSGNLLLQIVNDLLDLAKIEAGQMEIFREPVDLAAIAANVITTVSGLITDKPIELRQEIQPNLPKIYGDGTRLRQILLNLLGNAIKFTHQGSVTLRIVQESDTQIKVSVIDTGPGIKPEDFDKIFEEFKQSQEAFASSQLGTGLGLPISKKFVEMHGGRLWGESEYGKGSAFHFTLPVHPNPAPETIELEKESLLSQVEISD
jgi:signal transduction histidine kinase